MFLFTLITFFIYELFVLIFNKLESLQYSDWETIRKIDSNKIKE